MSSMMAEVGLSTLSTASLWASTIISMTRSRWIVLSRVLLLLSAASSFGLLPVFSLMDHSFPMTHGSHLLAATSAATVLWHLVTYRSASDRWHGFVIASTSTGLLVWASALRWPRAVPAPTLSAAQPWHPLSQLLLASACGGFLLNGSYGLGALASEMRKRKVQHHTVDFADPAITGFSLPFMLSSMLLAAIVNLTLKGSVWTWTAGEAWSTVLLLVQAASWTGIVFLHWAKRWAARWSTMGLLVTLLALSVLVR